jgi:hypothetical protein
VLLAVGVALVLSGTAAARTTGAERFDAVIVTSGATGTRVVVSTVIVLRGVFDGVGRVVEVENGPGEPDNVAHDDLVFRAGTMHLVTTTLDASVSVNPVTCLIHVTVQQSSMVVGGTGAFARARGSFTGTATALLLAARNPDGSCSEEQAPLHEIDVLGSSGTLSF